MKYFEKAVSSDPNDVDLQMNLALALTETGETDRAISAYSKVITLNPARGDAYDNLARLQFSAGDTPGAKATIASLEKAVSGYSGLADLKAIVH